MPFNQTTFSIINKCVKMHVAVVEKTENQRWCCTSERAVLGSYELHKLNGFQDNADGSGDFQNSRNASQLEQNEGQANIRGVRQNKAAWSPVSITLRGGAEVHRKAGVTSYPGHNLDCRTQTGHIKEGVPDKDRDRESERDLPSVNVPVDIFIQCILQNYTTVYSHLYMHCIQLQGLPQCFIVTSDHLH